MEEEGRTKTITGETEEEINKEYKNSTRKEEEDLFFVPSKDEGEEEEEINMDENNIIGMDKKAEGIRYYAPEEENEENSMNSTIVDKKKERTIGKLMTRSKVERGKVTNNDNKSKSTKKKIKVTQDNIPFGHVCDDISVDDDTPYVRIYCQNVSGIFDREGIGLDSAFKEIKQAGADIFTFNETHRDETKAVARRALRLSKQRMWRDNNEECKIVNSSSTAPVLRFTKPGGNLVGITGPLVGRIRETITDPYGRWCGYTLIGRDTKEIMILTAYNVSQYKNAKVGEDTLFNQ
jgi:hypothetical protein